MQHRRSLVHAPWPHKAPTRWPERTTGLTRRARFLFAALAGLALACSSAADVQRQQEAAWAAVERDADGLFAALEAVAVERSLPIDRRDPEGRRLTSFWMAESDDVRRRYFLSVLLHPAGLALHARIAREQRAIGQDGQPTWVQLDPTPEVSAEQQAIVEQAYARWADGQ